MSNDPVLTDSFGHPLHRWRDADGQEWACSVYDHRPMCRLCQPVDELLDSIFELVAEGQLIFHQQADGQFVMQTTEAGDQAARDLLVTLAMENHLRDDLGDSTVTEDDDA